MGTFIKKPALFLKRGKQIKKRAFKLPMAVLVCALLVVGGGIAYKAMATGIFSVSITPDAVDINQTTDIDFNITASGSKIKTIAVSVEGTGFSNPTDFTCPSGWSKIDAMPPILNGYVCDDPTDAGLATPAVTLTGLTAPDTAGVQNFSVSVINTDVDPQTENKAVQVEVKNLSAIAVVTPTTTNTEQERIYTFTVTNDGGSGSDSIEIVTINVPDSFTNISLGENPSGWTCGYTSPAITCTADSGSELADGSSLLINATATALATAGVTIWNVGVTGSLGGGMNPTIQPTITVQTPPSIEEVINTISPITVSQGQTGVSFSVNVQNTGEVSVPLDTSSTISFTANTITYSAGLSAETTIVAGQIGTLIFLATDIDANMINQGYNPVLTLSGIDANTAVFSQIIETENNPITVQTPASLSVGDIFSDVPAISKQSGAVNTATIDISVINSGEATADTLNKTVVVKDAGGADISNQFTISEKTPIISSVDGGVTQTLVWEVIAGTNTTYEGVAQIEISVLYNDANTDQQISTPATGSDTSIFTVDNVSPTGGSVDYINGYETDTTAEITVNQGNDSGGTGIIFVQLYKKEAGLADNTCGTFGDWTTESAQNLGDTIVNVTTESGKCYMFKYVATDEADNTGSYTSANVLKVDTSVPSQPVVTDDGTYTTDNTQLHATWTSSDDESGITNYEYAIGTIVGGDEVFGWTSVGTVTEITKTGLSLAGGTYYYISVRATNVANLISSIGGSDGIVVDITAPTGVNVNYTDGYETDNIAIVNISEGTDLESGVATVQLYKKEAGLADNTCGTFGDWTTESAQNLGDTIVNVTTESGKCYMFKYEAFNGAGLDTTYESTNVLKVDQIDPTGSLGGVPTTWQKTDATITLGCTDTGGSGCNDTADYYGTAATEVACIANQDYSVPVTIDSHLWFCWKVTDIAGNEDTGSSEILVDKTEPATEITSPAANSWQNTDFSLGVTDSDIGGSELNICRYMVKSKIGDNWVETKAWASRDCNSATPLITIGDSMDCQTEGKVESGNGFCRVYVDSEDNAGNSEERHRHFSIDWTAPDAATIVIANEDVVTKDATPTLALTTGGTAPNYMRFSCDGSAWGGWIAWNTNYELFDITTGAGCTTNEGEKTVYIQVKDNHENIQTTAGSDTIIYDGDNTLTVDDSGGKDFTTIQAAVNEATTGDKIEVADGTYSGATNGETFPITINEANLIIQSTDGAASTIIDAGGQNTDIVTITANDVTLNGFTIQNANGANVAGIKMNDRTGCDISNIAIKNITGTTYAFGIYGSGMNSNTFSDITIFGLSETGIAMDTGAFGIWLDSSDSNTFNRITVKDNTADSDCQGIMLYNGCDGNSFTDTIITNLETKGAEIVYPVGISVWAGGLTCNDNTFTNATTSNIRITGANGWTAGIQDRGGNTGNVYTNMDISNVQSTKWVYAVAIAGGSKATFNGGSIHDIVDTSLDRLWGISIWEDGSGAIIDGMSISGAQDGIHIRNAIDATFSKVRNSSISGNSAYGINHEGSNIFDATENWWGTAVKATIQGMFSGTVDFEPYWVDEVGGTLSTDVVSTVYVDDDYSDGDAEEHIFGYDAFDKIQEGVDAVAPSGTVNVGAGTYNEEIAINKSLTLLGATANINKNSYTVPANYAWDDTVESIINHPDPTDGYDTIVDIYDVDNVTFKGFVVQELNAVGNENTSLIRVYAHTREISNIVVRNSVIGPNTNTTAQDGAQGRMGLYIVNHPYSDQYGVINSTFSGNKIFDTKGNGNNVFIWSSYHAYGASGPASMSGTVIEDNEIYGSHRSGIETAGGFSGLTIRSNKIYGNSGPGDTPDLKYGNGILMIRGSGDRSTCDGYGPVNVTIENNEIYDNEDYAIYMGPKNQGIIITGNDIHGNGSDAVRVDLIGNYWNPDFESDPGPYTCLGGSQNVTVSDNIIENNNAGVQVIGTPTNGFVLDATKNYWGSIEGPTPTSINPHGAGDAVSVNVSFVPWCIGPTCTGDDIDETAPAAELSGTPVNPTKETGTNITVSGDQVVYYKYAYKIDEGDYGEYTVETSINTPITLSGLSDGDYVIKVIGRDQAGNWQSDATVHTWTIDLTPPTLSSVSIASNNNDTTLVKTLETVTLTFVSDENLIASPVVTIDGKPADTISQVNDAKHWTATRAMQVGDTEAVVVFTIDFTDEAGHTGTQVATVTDSTSVTFDKTAPVTTLVVSPTDPNGTNSWYKTTPTLTLTCVDQEGLSGCDKVYYKWDNTGDYVSYTESLAAPEGVHTLYYYSIDKAGNQEVAKTSTELKIDITNPAVSLLSPLAGTEIIGGSTAYISWTAGDTNLGDTPIKLEYTINGGTVWYDITEANHDSNKEYGINEYAWTVPNITSPSCYVRITATDLASNNSSQDIGAFTISRNDNPTPICTQVAGSEQWTCDIALNVGWNLISSPVIPNNTAIANVLSGVTGIDIVKYYDSGSWSSYKPGGSDNIGTIEDGKGYWINMTGTDTLTIIGLPNPSAVVDGIPTTPESYSLNTGWNLIGFRSVIDKTVANYIGSYIDYTGSNSPWEVDGTGYSSMSSSDNMTPGSGYWLLK